MDEISTGYLLYKFLKKEIILTNKNTLCHAFLPKGHNKSPINFEMEIYHSLPQRASYIDQCVSELAEIAHKSISRNETHTTELVVTAVKKIVLTYIDCRKDNRIKYPAREVNYMAHKSDLDVALTNIYDHLYKIAERSISAFDLTSCISVVQAYGDIAIHTLELKSNDENKDYTDLTFFPISYLGDTLDAAQIKQMDDVVLEGSRILKDISLSISEKVNVSKIHPLIIRRFSKIIQPYLLLKQKGIFVNQILDDMLSMMHFLVKLNHHQTQRILHVTLETLAGGLPLALHHEKQFGLYISPLPFSSPYNLVNRLSLGYLVNKATSFIQLDKEREWVNPYRVFLELNKEIYGHFRKIAEKNDLGASSFMYHMISTLKYIIDIFLKLIKESPGNDENEIKGLVQQVYRYMAFFWIAFSKSSKIDHDNALQACDALASIGLYCYTDNFKNNDLVLELSKEIVDQSIGCIFSIINSYSKFGEGRENGYNIAELIMFAWYLRLAAINESDNLRKDIIDKKIVDLDIYKKNEIWSSVIESITSRHEEFKSKVFGNDRFQFFERYKAAELLKGLLKDESIFDKYHPLNIKPPEEKI